MSVRWTSHLPGSKDENHSASHTCRKKRMRRQNAHAIFSLCHQPPSDNNESQDRWSILQNNTCYLSPTMGKHQKETQRNACQSESLFQHSMQKQHQTADSS